MIKVDVKVKDDKHLRMEGVYIIFKFSLSDNSIVLFLMTYTWCFAHVRGHEKRCHCSQKNKHKSIKENYSKVQLGLVSLHSAKCINHKCILYKQ
jgi:hypothetical protein